MTTACLPSRAVTLISAPVAFGNGPAAVLFVHRHCGSGAPPAHAQCSDRIQLAREGWYQRRALRVPLQIALSAQVQRAGDREHRGDDERHESLSAHVAPGTAAMLAPETAVLRRRRSARMT